MMRELFRNRMGLAVLAGLGLSAAASSANAALITMDMRVQGGPAKGPVVITAPGQTVTFEIWAQVQNNDGNRANDGFLQSQGNALSAEDAGLLSGDLAPVVLNTSLLDNAVSSGGTAQNLDALATDNEVGSLVVNTQAGFIVLNAGTSTKFGSGAGTGPTEFLLGTTTWTAETVPGVNSTDSINFGLRQSTSTLAAGRNYQFTSDGVAFAVRWDGRDSTGAIVPNAVAVGDAIPLVTAVPEPAALGLLGLGGLAALRRRRA